MNAFNSITSAVFDVLLAPWGHDLGWIDIAIWSVLSGIVALLIYKKVSNQRGITRAKERIKMHLLEIRLWRNDLTVVLGATGKILLRNFVYVAHNMLPMAVLMVPFLIVLFQLEAHFAFAPSPVGAKELLRVKLDPEAEVPATAIELKLPEGVRLDAPPVRTPDGEAFWRLEATAPGDHALELRVGDHTLTKTWAVGGEPRKVPIMRTRSWEGFLYPGEAGIPAGSPFYEVALRYPEVKYPWVPDGEFGVLVIFFVLSLGAGFALKDLFGVTF